MKNRLFGFLITSLVVVLAAAPLQAKIRKNMIWATPSAWNTLDPSIAYSTESGFLANIYETLVRVNRPGSDKPFDYVLATNIVAQQGGLEYIVDLRKGVTFHDGTPFNAAAVKFSIERTRRINKGAAFIWNEVKDIEVVNDYRVRVALKSSVPFPMIASSVYAAYMISPKVGKAGEKYFKRPLGCRHGPYRLASYKAGESWMLTKFKDYWRGWNGPHLDNILFKFVPNPLTQYQMLKSGQADVVSNIPPEMTKAVKADPNLRFLTIPSIYNYLMFFNTQRKPFDNLKVRKALSHAIPYADIIKVGFAGNALPPRSIIPAGQFGHSKNVGQNEYDLNKARRLLAEAGYPNGFKATLTWTAENPAESRFVLLIKDSFKKIGVEIELQSLMWKAHWAKGKGPAKDRQDLFVVLWWPTFADPYETLWILHDESKSGPSWNLSYWYNKDYDNLVTQAYQTIGIDAAEGLRLYEKAQNMILDQAVIAPLADQLFGYQCRSYVKGYDPFPFRMGIFYDMYIDE